MADCNSRTLHQIVDLAGNGDSFDWLLDWHNGHFGSLSLEVIYPFLNAAIAKTTT